MIKQRRMIANYIDVAKTGAEQPNFAFMGAGFKDLNENPSAQTKSRQYICDKSATQTINSYSWSTPFELDQIREQEAVDFICNIGELQLTGADTERDFIMAEMTKPIESKENTYYARKIKVAVEISSFTNDEGDLGASGNLLGQGDIIEGEFNTKTRTFTAKATTTAVTTTKE